ncbi:integrase arm-type DNA-binding domain-containing protein [Sphingomonas sp. AR_OL41]|nr:integrase arm-type DNA-binding domain-containing protein [Sphingomonas sp. AR_OL41]MDH7972770.1 integrase arm-type DNA-binding domain-containing protein [Sphingomonas sp. AR_OL41]
MDSEGQEAMAQKPKELGALAVSRLSKPGLHFVGGVSGLALQVAPAGSRSWVLRATVGSKRRDMGLGGYPDVTLAGAKEAARMARDKIRNGVDPIAERTAARSALLSAHGKSMNFEAAALAYIAAHESGWRNAKHIQQWRNSLEGYAYPVIGKLLVRDVDLTHVMKILEPMWETKTETATRLRGRIEQVLDWATVRGYRDGLNPARWRGHLDKLLTAPNKLAKVKHHQALPWAAIGGFMAKLRQGEGMGARALEFAILTAARSGEVRGATWDEIDLEAAEWNIPAERMKANKAHRVPLSSVALAMLKALPRIANTNLVFPAPRGGLLSDMTLTAVLRRMKVEAVPHGFRSTFRDWVAETTSYPNHVAEMALAHTIGNKVEAAYRRDDLFPKRVVMMEEWAGFCGLINSATVVALKRSASA